MDDVAREEVKKTINAEGRFQLQGILYNLGKQNQGKTVILTPLFRGKWAKGFEVLYEGKKLGEGYPSEKRFIPAEIVRNSDDKGRFSVSRFGYRTNRFSLGAVFSRKQVKLVPRSDDWRIGFIVFYKDNPIALYDATENIFSVLVEERQVDSKGRFSWKGDRYSLGALYANNRLTLKPYKNYNWNNGFRVYYGGEEIAYYDKITGQTKGFRSEMRSIETDVDRQQREGLAQVRQQSEELITEVLEQLPTAELLSKAE